jgi:ABC-type branched-subunit amino acid transport system ATPase component
MAMSLRCERLDKAFDGIHALAGVSIEFPGSGCVGIIGPNGAGKSTLLNALTGFVRPDSGSSFLDNDEITFLSPHEIVRRGIARTFQRVRLIERLSVLGNVMLAKPDQRGERLWNCLTRRGGVAEEAENFRMANELLEAVNLLDKASYPATDLSYGQQKLLGICCCLATGAQILLLDEPVAGIHPDMILRISQYIRGIADQGRLVVFVEHDIEMVRQTADFVIVMDAGRVIANGKPDEILNRREILEAYIS